MKLFKSLFEEIAGALGDRKRAAAEFGHNYTPRACQVFELAQEEAKRLKHNFIGTEHVLLGLVRLGQGVAANVLRREGVDLEKLRLEVERYVLRASEGTLPPPFPFTPRMKRVLETAQKEARSLSHTYVGTEHILLGLLGDDDGAASRVLRSFGLDASRIRQEVLKELDPNFVVGGEPPEAGKTPI
jgi:ATP-dependent Clp protease ATP-binding subunit ClpC